MTASSWIRVSVANGQLRIESNVPFPVAVALLESGKAKLITDSFAPAPVGAPGPTEPAQAAARAPGFDVRTVA